MTRLHHSFTLLRTSPQHERARPAIYGKCEQLTPRKMETIIQLQAQNLLIEQRQPKGGSRGVCMSHLDLKASIHTLDTSSHNSRAGHHPR